ncbi:tripartite tricarboxylate transporter TctB family protein [Actibacterium sp. MT2.3-13A]|uniref:tripartite tricarboxylate transporter TctB family protein n=1 Tax=Actibacterium sp. MT2.3-13A TaxID=2828332 RepID=UPI001BAB8286|nr:tripartite tricarboxylate transporter TctB family protein [Actibacterium sp. MT2.3-13A]
MTDRRKDTVFSCVMFLLAGAWTWQVLSTIPPGYGDGDIGPRAFPLAFGLILLALAALLFVTSWPPDREDLCVVAPGGKEVQLSQKIHWLPSALLLGELVLYGFLLEKLGFLIATPVVILLVMMLNLRIRSLRRLFGMSLGLTLGCWLVFEKLLGIYLASGTWIDLG